MTRLVTCNDKSSRKTRKRLIQPLVYSVFLYGVETLITKTNSKRRIDAFVMWVWRRMLRILTSARRTNISIVNEIEEPVRLSILWERRILGYFGHVTRREVRKIEKDILLGKAPGKRGRARSPTRWFDIIKAQMGSVVRAASQTQDSDRWCALLGEIW